MNSITGAFGNYIKEAKIKVLSGVQRNLLKSNDFTIISNNCWGGWVYRKYGIKYLSPTVGLYMFAEDYIDFCENLELRLNSRLDFISVYESKYRDELIRRKQTNVPIGVLGNDTEIVFLHYKNAEEAYEKWNRRLERVNLNNLILKFSEMNLCNNSLLEEFEKVLIEKKVCFTVEDHPELESCVAISKIIKNGVIMDDTTYYDGYINLTQFINDGKIVRTKYARH